MHGVKIEDLKLISNNIIKLLLVVILSISCNSNKNNMIKEKNNRLFIEKFTDLPLHENSYILYDNNSKECYIIDPGSLPDKIINFVEKNSLKVRAVLNTHGHFDHTFYNDYLANHFNVKVLLDSREGANLERGIKNFHHIYKYSILSKVPKNKFDITKPLYIGKHRIDIFETPGHTEGSLSFVIKDIKTIFTGDTLFKGTIGRTDLPGGSFDEIKKSILKLFIFPNDYIIYSGHGENSTIGYEKKYNYILKFL